MSDLKDVMAASVRIGDLLHEVALQNAEVVSADPSMQATIVFNASVNNLARVVSQMCSANIGSKEEFLALFPKIQHEIFSACMQSVERNARKKITIIRKEPPG